MLDVTLVAAALTVALQLFLLRALARVEKKMPTAQETEINASLKTEAQRLSQLVADQGAQIAKLTDTNGALTAKLAVDDVASNDLATKLQAALAAADNTAFDADLAGTLAVLKGIGVVPASVEPVAPPADPTPAPPVDPTPPAAA